MPFSSTYMFKSLEISNEPILLLVASWLQVRLQVRLQDGCKLGCQTVSLPVEGHNVFKFLYFYLATQQLRQQAVARFGEEAELGG